MPSTPQRPFVPQRVPSTRTPAVTTVSFHLPRPFIPGSAVKSAAVTPGPANAAFVASPVEGGGALPPLPPIEQFLETWSQPVDDYVAGNEEEIDELPPVEHFMDPLPEVGSFAPDVDGALLETNNGVADIFARVDTGGGAAESGWGDTDWQDYDWRSAAALGEGASSEATDAWVATDWDSGSAPPRARDTRETAAHAIAAALDRLAQRIRDGELAVPPRGLVPDQATIAATLAALLGVRR